MRCLLSGPFSKPASGRGDAFRILLHFCAIFAHFFDYIFFFSAGFAFLPHFFCDFHHFFFEFETDILHIS